MPQGQLTVPDDDELIEGPVPLTPREELFCRAFADPESLTYGRATKSASAAGYVQPHNASWRLRRRPRIIARLEEYQEAAAAGLGKVMSDLEHTRLLALEKGDLATAARCSELQGKRLGAFIERNILTEFDLTRQRVLTVVEEEEAHRLAGLLLLDGGRVRELPAGAGATERTDDGTARAVEAV